MGNNNSVEVNSELLQAVKARDKNRIKQALKNGADIHTENDTAVILACETGDLEIVKYLMKKGADIHAQNEEALYQACEQEHFEVVKFLLENKANCLAQRERLKKLESCEIAKELSYSVDIFHEDKSLKGRAESAYRWMHGKEPLLYNGVGDSLDGTGMSKNRVT
jgi:ankyrin repeat protein